MNTLVYTSFSPRAISLAWYLFLYSFQSIIFFCRSDWVTYGRSLRNLYGNDTSGISGLHGHFNTVGGNGADSTSLFLQSQTGNAHPEDVDNCPVSDPKHFLDLLDKYQVLNPEKSASAQNAHLNLKIFTQVTPSLMNCLLQFSSELIEIARIRWALLNFFTALELKLSSCVFVNENFPRLKHRKIWFIIHSLLIGPYCIIV